MNHPGPTNPNEQEAELKQRVRSLVANITVDWDVSHSSATIDINTNRILALIASERKSWKTLTEAERAELEMYRRERSIALDDYHEFGKAPVGSPERLTAYISYLSPHNLTSGAEALRDWRKSWAQQAVEAIDRNRVEVMVPSITTIDTGTGSEISNTVSVVSVEAVRTAILSIGEGGKS